MDGTISSRLLSQENYALVGTTRYCLFELVATTTYNDVGSKPIIVMKTRLLKIGGKWLVNDVELISSAS